MSPRTVQNPNVNGAHVTSASQVSAGAINNYKARHWAGLLSLIA